jgi:hypothetical protein
MTELDPDQRIDMAQIKNHPWYIESCTLNEIDVKEIFLNRFKQLNEELI